MTTMNIRKIRQFEQATRRQRYTPDKTLGELIAEMDANLIKLTEQRKELARIVATV